mmetsp:Transcript_31397/g.41828  ORF Transcript_31397/g.41828 Transcript_31397/m.41828 type:complete len:254 (+) Transcript_31397:209-970(+)
MTSTTQLTKFLQSYTTIATISPLTNNILASLLTVLYVKLVLETGAFILYKLQKPELSRKFIHVCAASWIVFWPLFDTTHWSWRLNVLVPVAMFFKLLYKGAILRDPNDAETMSMSRSSNPTELLYGPLHFTMLMTWVGLYRFMSYQGIVIMSSMIGDGIAPLAASCVQNSHTYRIRPLGGIKSWEGSVGVCIGTVFAIYTFSYALGMEVLRSGDIVMFGVLASLVEAASPGRFDNLSLTVLMDFSFEKIVNLG